MKIRNVLVFCSALFVFSNSWACMVGQTSSTMSCSGSGARQTCTHYNYQCFATPWSLMAFPFSNIGEWKLMSIITIGPEFPSENELN
jgi:hypothetical protein